MADPNFAVVTDSGADLPVEVARELDIRVVPLSIHFGEEIFLDGVTLDSQAFYKRLVEGRELPHTTQPAPGDFHQVYQALHQEGVRKVLSVHLSSKLSGTIQSATIAAGEFEDMEIVPVDSLSASMGLGMLAMAAARKAREGQSLAETTAYLEELREQTSLVFAVGTLEYLARNGRIGRAQSLVGGLLNVKPVLGLQEGEVVPLERTRGRNRALQEVVDRTVAALGDRPARLAVVHSMAEAEAESVRERIAQQCKLEEVHLTLLGPTIGTHTGPGTVGALALPV